VAELQRLTQRQLQHLLGPRRERDVPARRLLTLADDLFYLLTHTLKRDAEALQRLGRHALTLVDEAEQDVLRADVVVVEHPGFFLRQDDDSTGTVGEPLEHGTHVLAARPHAPRRQGARGRGDERSGALSLSLLASGVARVGSLATLVPARGILSVQRSCDAGPRMAVGGRR
jgi:hypothetical protein